jgi:hypothetical protein
VPRCWLAGFTDSGDQDGTLWVTDFMRRKQRQAIPGSAGFINDYYRLSDDQLDPVMVEKALSQMEGAVAPILRTLDKEQRAPGVDELSVLLPFIAIQWARVPSFRPMILDVLNTVTRERLAIDLKIEESWKRALKKAGIAEDAAGASYEGMVRFQESGEYSLDVQTDWYIQQMFKSAEHIPSYAEPACLACRL